MKITNKMPLKIAVPTSETIELINVSDIIRIDADRNYSNVYTLNNETYNVTKSLIDFQKVLDSTMFIRIHKSHIINIAHVQRILRVDCGYIEMKDGAKILVSRRRKNCFEKAIESFVKQM